MTLPYPIPLSRQAAIPVVQVDGSGNVLDMETPPGYPDFVTNQVSINSGGVLIVAARTGRRGVLVVNHGTIDVFLGAASVTTSSGVKLKGSDGASIYIPISGALYGITVSSTQTVSYMEIF
jgi:hypothetical protein